MSDEDTKNPGGKDPETGRFVTGNRFWETTLEKYGKFGPDPAYKTDADVLKAAAEYFEDITSNPLLTEKSWQSEGAVVTHDAPVMRAMTIQGLCNHMGIGYRTWVKYRLKRPELQPVIEIIEQIIYQQKFEGAAAGLLNAHLISRDLKLEDTTTIKGPGKDGAHVIEERLTPLESGRRVAFMLRQAAEQMNDEKAEPDEAPDPTTE
jgi:hypothetical protein